MKIIVLLIMLTMSASALAKHSLADIKAPEKYDNIFVKKLATNAHTSDFVIFIKDNVPLHYHETHTEIVLILAGEAQMTQNNETFAVTAGDYIRIPPNTTHGVKVTSSTPLKVLSIQAPEFLGKDRVMVKKTTNGTEP